MVTCIISFLYNLYLQFNSIKALKNCCSTLTCLVNVLQNQKYSLTVPRALFFVSSETMCYLLPLMPEEREDVWKVGNLHTDVRLIGHSRMVVKSSYRIIRRVAERKSCYSHCCHFICHYCYLRLRAWETCILVVTRAFRRGDLIQQ